MCRICSTAGGLFGGAIRGRTLSRWVGCWQLLTDTGSGLPVNVRKLTFEWHPIEPCLVCQLMVCQLTVHLWCVNLMGCVHLWRVNLCVNLPSTYGVSTLPTYRPLMVCQLSTYGVSSYRPGLLPQALHRFVHVSVPGFGVWGLGFRVFFFQGLGFRFWGSGFEV